MRYAAVVTLCAAFSPGCHHVIDHVSSGDGPTDCNQRRCYYVDAASSLDGAAPACGSSWREACREMPAALERGATYFVADGEYDGFTVDEPEQGELTIVVKKATAADHGSDDGWRAELGDGHARWTGPIGIYRGWVTLDGATGGGPGSWTGGHGFRVLGQGDTHHLLLGNKGGATGERHDVRHVTIRRLEIGGESAERGSGIDMTAAGTTNGDVTVERCYIHDVEAPLRFIETDDLRVVRNAVARSDTAFNCIGCDRATLAYNRFSEFGGMGAAICAGGACAEWRIHGNLFFYPQGATAPGYANAAVGTTSSPNTGVRGWRVHHNTFVNLPGRAVIALYAATGQADNKALNNLYHLFRNGPAFVGIEHGHGFFSEGVDDETYRGTAGHQVSSGDPLVDWRGGDFSLAAPTSPGARLDPPFDRDALGRQRGADGVWDRGALELVR